MEASPFAAYVLVVFNSQCAAHVKLCLLRNMQCKRKFPFGGSVNLGKVWGTDLLIAVQNYIRYICVMIGA